MSISTYSQDADLAKYFTDVEPLRVWFDQAIAAETLPKRLLVLWGVGGIGKSSLLRMFRLSARGKKIPVGLASGDEAKSAVDVLARWAEDLKNDSVTLSTFFKTHDHYRAIQAKVEDQAKAANQKLGDAAVKGAGKMAEAGAAAVVGAAVGSVIPGVGTIAGAIGGMGAEALADWLRGFLSKPDIDLYTDPTKRLTEDFLADLDKAALKQRIVLMLDTYEQMTALDDWTRELAQRLNPNVLLVIAGRAIVNWGRKWDSWLMYAQVEEVKPMSKRVMHELIRKYYATMRGGEPNPKQVNDIIEFSGGLPMVVNTAVQLWVKYGVEDFGAVKGEVVKAVVERLREGVPPELYPLLETAAALRYFNQDILRAVSGMEDISAGYEELLRFPFVRRRAEGYALHDRVREMIEENVRTDDEPKYRNVHERAAAYFEARMENALGEDAERIGLERLYHRVCADEETGVLLFQETAENLVRYRTLNKFRALLADSTTYPLHRKSSCLWRDYYFVRMTHIDEKGSAVESLYMKLSEDDYSDSKLRAYAKADFGAFLVKTVPLKRQGGIERAKKVISESLEYPIDSKLIWNYAHLGGMYVRLANDEEAMKNFKILLDYMEANRDLYGYVRGLILCLGLYARVGNWREMFRVHREALAVSISRQHPSFAMSETLVSWKIAWGWTGHYREGETHILRGSKIHSELGYRGYPYMKPALGFLLALQERYVEAQDLFSKELQKDEALGEKVDASSRATTIMLFGISLLKNGDIGRARELLSAALTMRKEVKAERDYVESYYWLAQSYESGWTNGVNPNEDDLEVAKHAYQEGARLEWTRRFYFSCGCSTGLLRLYCAQQDYPSVLSFFTEAEQLAQQYEYNDHLASLRLTQGHIAWDGHIPEWGKGFDAAFEFYKLVLVYALRYDRFLLDEVLSGRPQGTPLRPIVTECLKRGEEGRKMLVALREWWQTGLNDVGMPRPDTISPILENIALLEAEKIAREREPGDGSAQTNVTARLDAALAN